MIGSRLAERPALGGKLRIGRREAGAALGPRGDEKGPNDPELRASPRPMQSP
jgi:hypothetical protein